MLLASKQVQQEQAATHTRLRCVVVVCSHCHAPAHLSQNLLHSMHQHYAVL